MCSLMKPNELGDQFNEGHCESFECYHLDSRFSEVKAKGQLLPGEEVWVMGLLKGPLQYLNIWVLSPGEEVRVLVLLKGPLHLVQLEGGEGGPRP